jgi:hypothetical protein
MAAHGGSDLPESDIQETGKRNIAADIAPVAHAGKDVKGAIK